MHRNLRIPLLTLATLGLFGASGCTFHSTAETEVGVLTRKFTLFDLAGHLGIQPQIYAPGATYLFPALITDWHTFDVSLQNLHMTQRPASDGNEGIEDDLMFKTIDGNDIRLDVTVVWQIVPEKAPNILARVGRSTRHVRDKLVRPAARSVVRDVLNELRSEDFYVSERRHAKAEQARDQLAAELEPEGIRIHQVILGEHHFHAEYEQVIRDKKLAEQNADRLSSEGRAASERAKQRLEEARGKVQQQLEEAKGYLATVKLEADAGLFEAERRAEAALEEGKAIAQAYRKQTEAYAGAGGETQVKLRLAEALKGKELVFLPTGSGGANLQTLNLNALLETYGPKGSQSTGVTPAPKVTRASGP